MFDSRNSRKTYDAKLANRFRVDDALREREVLSRKNSVHVNNYSIYKALDAHELDHSLNLSVTTTR